MTRFAPTARAARRLTTSANRWSVAVVGSGPAAFYAADHLLRHDADVHVDIFEQLPLPYGLVRFGVAPDHQDVKNVTERFAQIAAEPRCGFFGNVCVGDAAGAGASSNLLPLPELRRAYSAVVLACGAGADRELGVPGEALRGVRAAREFVNWYNGHPDAVSHDFGLADCEAAAVVGMGNVAIDCARVLLCGVDALRKTDVPEYALAALAESKVRRVTLLGRRGPLQAAFTIKELRELSKLEGVAMALRAPADAFSPAVIESAKGDRARRRIVELMQKLHVPDAADGSDADDGGDGRRVDVRFLRSPVGFAPSAAGGDALGAVELQRMRLVGEPSVAQRVEADGDAPLEALGCGLALRSVGYRSEAVAGAPFDDQRAVVPNEHGRVTGEEALYVSGWLKRGPSGVILTNVNDAAETAAALLADRAAGILGGGGGGGEAIAPLLAAQPAPVVDFGGWLKVDAEERARGAKLGKVREKVTDVDEMLRVACG